MPINSPKKRILLRQAFEYFEARKYKEALASFSKALCLDSQDLEAKIELDKLHKKKVNSSLSDTELKKYNELLKKTDNVEIKPTILNVFYSFWKNYRGYLAVIESIYTNSYYPKFLSLIGYCSRYNDITFIRRTM